MVSLRSLISPAVIKETITKPIDRLKELKGKVVDSVEGNGQQVVIKFDDGSEFTINTPDHRVPIEYHLSKGMIKPNVGNETGSGPTSGTQV